MFNTVQSAMGKPVAATNGECSLIGANDVEVVYVKSLHSNKQVLSTTCFVLVLTKLPRHSMCSLLAQIVAFA